jgi:DNA-binding SARP family transcriptional activator
VRTLDGAAGSLIACAAEQRRGTVTGGRVAFGVLGPLRVTGSDGVPIGVPAAKQRIILAALLLSANMTVSAGQLADALWEASPPPTAAASIRTYVSRLRRTLGPAGRRLVSRPAGYAIEIREPSELDLTEVARLRGQSQEAAAAGNWSRAASLCRQALSLWRGAPLEDTPSAALQLSDAERLTELRIEIATACIDAELNLGQASSLVTELRELAGLYPLREHLQAQLMLAYYRCGRQTEALAAYHAIRGTLATELGIEPGPELRTLHQLILAADPVLNTPH